MSYFPLDRDILTSSLWAEGTPEAFKVWAYLLLSADPRDGIVRDSVPGIAIRCGLSVDVTEGVLEWLGSPDKHSRTKAHEGRRIAMVDGGIQVLNYTSRRDKDYSTPRVKRWRERLATVSETDVTVSPKPPRVGDVCPCCSSPFDTPLNKYVVLDHNHSTGALREYICQSCNKIVGQVENRKYVSDKAKEANARAYLRRHETVTSVPETTNTNTNTENKTTTTEGAFQAPSRDPLELMISVFNAVFGTRNRVLGTYPAKFKSRCKTYKPWQMVAAPLLIKAQMTRDIKVEPRYLFQDGKHMRRTSQGYDAGVDWIEPALEKAGETVLDARLSAIAIEADKDCPGLLDGLRHHGVTLSEVAA